MYKVGHIHLKAPDPRATAQWYAKNFEARIEGEGEGLGDAITVHLDIGGTHINISGAPAGQTLPKGTVDYHFGLDHFGLMTDDIVGDVERLQKQGVKVLVPVSKGTAKGSLYSYIKGPDDVLIELVQVKG